MMRSFLAAITVCTLLVKNHVLEKNIHLFTYPGYEVK